MSFGRHLKGAKVKDSGSKKGSQGAGDQGDENEQKSLPAGAVIIIVVMCVVFVFAGYLCWRGQNQKKRRLEAEQRKREAERKARHSGEDADTHGAESGGEEQECEADGQFDRYAKQHDAATTDKPPRKSKKSQVAPEPLGASGRRPSKERLSSSREPSPDPVPGDGSGSPLRPRTDGQAMRMADWLADGDQGMAGISGLRLTATASEEKLGSAHPGPRDSRGSRKSGKSRGGSKSPRMSEPMRQSPRVGSRSPRQSAPMQRVSEASEKRSSRPGGQSMSAPKHAVAAGDAPPAPRTSANRSPRAGGQSMPAQKDAVAAGMISRADAHRSAPLRKI